MSCLFPELNGILINSTNRWINQLRRMHEKVFYSSDKDLAFLYINVKEDYPMVIKHYGDGFNKTDLDKILQEKGVNTVFLCGLSATGCVLATYIGAENHDYNVFMIQDALLSQDLERG